MKPSHHAAAVDIAATFDGELQETVEDERASQRSRTVCDRRARIAELMEAHGEDVYGFCKRVVRIPPLAKEVVQQVYLEAFRDLDLFTGRSSPRKWLLGIAAHRCVDALRALQRRSKLIEVDEQAMLRAVDPSPGPGERLDRTRLIAALEDCLMRLSPEVCATVLLRFQVGATYEEMAVQLGASAEALQMRVARALPMLRRCLEKKGWTDE